MKLIGKNSILLVLSIMVLSGCMRYKDYVVESDYSYQGKFKKYRTFNFIRETNVADTSYQSIVIENAIKSRLELQGYRMHTKKPNILVSYRVFNEDLNFKGFNQPDIQQWVKTEKPDIDYSPIDYSLKQGTLLVILVDSKKQNAIWQGYASGLFGQAFSQNERALKGAVRSIFDRFQFFVEGVEEEGEI
ncbi:MAG: DUF4136 domain-containing protein [Bacteroidota bacterium]|nr:DUF4136 domain-containing protein [Bacteroidota bacterium]